MIAFFFFGRARRTGKKKGEPFGSPFLKNSLAEWTGLEPATPGVTGRYSNQLNYHSAARFLWRNRRREDELYGNFGDCQESLKKIFIVSRSIVVGAESLELPTFAV